MTRKVNIHEAKTRLSQLLGHAARGEEVVIAKAGEPVARLVPYSTRQRMPGLARGRGKLTAEFFAPLPVAELRRFERGG